MASRARQLSKLLSSDLLTVDVNNNRIGVNSTSPEEVLDVGDSLNVGNDILNVGISSVGIGINNSNAKLRVEGNAGNLTGQFRQGANTVIERTIIAQSTNGNNFGAFVDDSNVRHLVSGQNDVLTTDSNFVTLHTNSSTERMRITSGGSVGIGTTNPRTSLTAVHDTFFQVSPPISGISTLPGVESISVLSNGQVALGRSVIMPGAAGFQTSTSTMTRGETNVSIYVGNDDSDKLSRVMSGTSSYTGEYGEVLIEGTKPGVASSADQTWGIRFHQGNGNGNASNRCSAAIHAIRSNDTNGSTDLAFKTRSGSSDTAEKMVITSNGLVQFNSGIGSARYTAYGVRAWANFDGSGTLSIRASGNCSSITDSGTGVYDFNFINPMPDNDYVFTGSTARNATPSFTGSGAIMSATSFRMSVGNGEYSSGAGFNAEDVDHIMVIVIR